MLKSPMTNELAGNFSSKLSNCSKNLSTLPLGGRHTGEISGLAALCNFGYFGGFRDLSNNEYVFWVGVAACAGRIQRTVMEQVCNSSLYLSVRITSNLLIIKITSVALENT